MLSAIIKFLFGILALPLAVAATAALYHNLGAVTQFSGALHIFSWGIVSYFIIHIFFYKPVFLYVFGHEAVHAITAWLCGGRIASFKASKNGGKVATDRSNLFITLSPYFIPLYTIIILVIYYIISASYHVRSEVFIFLIGFSIAFHLALTVEAIKLKQPDITRSGPVFSVVFVYILNVIVIAVIFGILFSDFALRSYFSDFFVFLKRIYLDIFYQLFLR